MNIKSIFKIFVILNLSLIYLESQSFAGSEQEVVGFSTQSLGSRLCPIKRSDRWQTYASRGKIAAMEMALEICYTPSVKRSSPWDIECISEPHASVFDVQATFICEETL